jgi:hypothetical protein
MTKDYPCLLYRVRVCVFLKRKEARIARAASTLALYARQINDDTLFEQMYSLQEKLWDAIYPKNNQ